MRNKIHLFIFIIFYLIQPSSKQIIWFDFGKQNSVLPIVFYVPCGKVLLGQNEKRIYIKIRSLCLRKKKVICGAEEKFPNSLPLQEFRNYFG